MEMDFAHIWAQMSIAVKAIMMILVFMSVYSLGVSLERWWAFRVAKKQSVKFAIEIGPLLKQEKLKEAIDLAKKYKGSHIAKVVSPGLLATVIGIIRAFQGMATSGTGGLGAVSAGIAEALIGTALGLFVAIPAVWLYNYFLNKIERFNIEMSNSSSELVDYFIKRMGSRAA